MSIKEEAQKDTIEISWSDACIGINWDVINCWIDHIVEERK